MELVSLQTYTAPGGLAELPQLAVAPSPLLFDEARLRQIRRYVRCGLELPLGLYNSLAVVDAACGLKSYRFLCDLKNHCRQWGPLEKDLLTAGDGLSAFGEGLSRFCTDASKQILALPILQRAARCREDEGWRRHAAEALSALKCQADTQRKACEQLRDRMDQFRKTMDNAIVPQSDVVCAAMEQLEPLKLETPWFHAHVDHCGFLAEDPVIRGFVRDLKNAGDESEAVRIRESLRLTAQPIWERMLTAFSGLSESRVAVADAAAGIRNLNVLWTAVALHLDAIGDSLTHAEEASRLLLLANDLASCAASWRGIAGYGGQLRAALKETEYN